jgi:hypothetical protein
VHDHRRQHLLTGVLVGHADDGAVDNGVVRVDH